MFHGSGGSDDVVIELERGKRRELTRTFMEEKWERDERSKDIDNIILSTLVN